MEQENKSRADKLFKKINRKIGQTIREKSMIVENDRVLVGLSGGKDSLILLESLVNRKKAFPFSFEIFVAHIIPENIDYHVDLNYLHKFCNNLGLDLIVQNISFDPNASNKSPCFICSWKRRNRLFDLSKDLNCNKIALGHHRDDVLQTFLINMIYHGSISAMPYNLKMFDGRIRLIRPMLDLWEADLEELAQLRNYDSVAKTCPFEEKTKRKFASDLLRELEKDLPHAKRNMFHSLDNIYPEYLPGVKKKLKH